MLNNPLVSIIIPVYNGSNYMREAIESALAQTYKNIEIIVVNDGSKDDGKTEAIALEYGDKINYIYKANGGVSSALNVGIQNMKGEYFSWLSHDDVYNKYKIEKQVEVLKKYNDKHSIIMSFCNFIDKNSVIINSKNRKTYESKLEWNLAIMHITKHGANGCSLLIPRTAFQEAGMFDEKLRYCQDILMWWNIFLARYNLIFCDHIGVYSRIHEQQLTRTGSSLYHKDARYIGDIIVEKFAKNSTKNVNLLFEYAKQEAIHGNYDITKKCMKVGKEYNLINLKYKFILFGYGLYGVVRPLIRVVYYKLKHGIKMK